MYVGVLLHVGLLVEAFAAEVARERAGVAVNQQVGRQRRRTLHITPASATNQHLVATKFAGFSPNYTSREIATKLNKTTFLVFSSVAVGLCLERA